MRPVQNVFQKLSRTEQRREGVAAYLWTKVLLFTVTSTNGRILLPPPPLSKSGLKVVCNVNILYDENSQDYVQKPQ